MANANLSCITFTLVILISTSVTVTNGLIGTRTKVDDVKSNKAVQEIGRYSVEEYNRLRTVNDDGGLRFLEVVEAEKQVVAGMKYYLKVVAVEKMSGELNVFESVVVVKPWIRSKELVKFVPVKVDLLPEF